MHVGSVQGRYERSLVDSRDLLSCITGLPLQEGLGSRAENRLHK
jgi:hypothetical protein